MTKDSVLAVHKVTGIISEVPVHLLDLIPALEKASESQVKAAQKKLETEIYGAPIKVAEAKASAPTEGGKA